MFRVILWIVLPKREKQVDPAPIMELGTPSRNEYVTRLSDYQELQPLLDYLLPVLPSDHGARSASSSRACLLTSLGNERASTASTSRRGIGFPLNLFPGVDFEV
jgi:hypothetical protein